MNVEYLSVMALEEYPPNPEFLGRNFNAGEVIQLVLKDKAGRWHSFRFVQMVMMHELAHCKQMNHSRYFWKERNRFAEQMEGLWAAGYKGEGLWGSGQDLASGDVVPDRMPDGVDIPEHLCGGTYRRGRGKKRKRGQDGTEKPTLTYAERQQRRIAKKFGVHGEGQSVGDDELVRGALEQGKRHYGKPRVANSKRGRELRANAALARFEAAKKETPDPELDDSETESEDDTDGYADGSNIFATLERIKDQQGNDLYKVCGDEGEQDEGGQDELDDLRSMGIDAGNNTGKSQPKNVSDGEKSMAYDDSDTESEPDASKTTKTNGHAMKTALEQQDNSETESEPDIDNPPALTMKGRKEPAANLPEPTAQYSDQVTLSRPIPAAPPVTEASFNHAARTACPICSLENDSDAPTCIACSHVLKPSLMRNRWSCGSEQCKGSRYINAGDVGRCGLCGAQKPNVDPAPMGVTGGDVLRWD
jgi:hypothetical protein